MSKSDTTLDPHTIFQPEAGGFAHCDEHHAASHDATDGGPSNAGGGRVLNSTDPAPAHVPLRSTASKHVCMDQKAERLTMASYITASSIFHSLHNVCVEKVQTHQHLPAIN